MFCGFCQAGAKAPEISMAIKLHVLPEKHLMTLPESWNHHTPWRKTMVMESQTQTLVALVWGGEQIQILAVACLSESKGDAEIITPFKVAERNLSGNGTSTPSGDGELSPDGQFATQNGDSPDRGEFDLNVAGGVARSKAKCCALPNGDT
ncbi:hypothetical protein HID58_052964 [Brassica napus]|uniref:Uncharacterized protein n=1 Tax=Brassica napus TaxID=3708 RepID=A0ABQ8ADC3_BRANA|nr:hypothetical protein HID58_052964 [Brassica napus]